MVTAEARIRTEQSSRYLVQLCKHAGKMSHRRMHSQSHEAQARPEVLQVEWSDTAGLLRLNWGSCTMRADQDTLTLRVEAADEESLQRVGDLLGRNIERFGKRDGLKVDWQQV